MSNTILFRGDNVTYREDITRVATVTPGMLIEFAADDSVKPHSTSAGTAAACFANAADSVGGDISDVFASGSRVPYLDCGKGIIIYALLASGQNVARGDFLMSNGAGYLTARTSTNYAVAQADEDLNLSSGSPAGGNRIRARVL